MRVFDRLEARSTRKLKQETTAEQSRFGWMQILAMIVQGPEYLRFCIIVGRCNWTAPISEVKFDNKPDAVLGCIRGSRELPGRQIISSVSSI